MSKKQDRLRSFLYKDTIEKTLLMQLNNSISSSWKAFSEVCQDSDSSFSASAKKFLKNSNNYLFNSGTNDIIYKERQELLDIGISDFEDELYFGNLSVYLGDFTSAALGYDNAINQLMQPNNEHENANIDYVQRYLISICLSHFHLYDKFLTIFPNDFSNELPITVLPDALFRLAIVLSKTKRYSASIKVLKNLFNMTQHRISKDKIALQLSECYLQLGMYTDGIKLLEPFATNDSLDIATQLCFLMLLTDDTYYADNAMRIASCFPLLSQSFSLQYVTLRLMWKRNAIKDAISLVSNILYMNPKHSPTWCTLGLIYTCNGQLNDALKAFGMAINHNTNMIEAWANFGAILELNPALGDPIAFYKQGIMKTSFDTYFRIRIDILQKNIERKPTMSEPNDREYFQTPAFEQAEMFLLSEPKIPPQVVTHKEIKEEPEKVTFSHPKFSFHPTVAINIKPVEEILRQDLTGTASEDENLVQNRAYKKEMEPKSQNEESEVNETTKTETETTTENQTTTDDNTEDIDEKNEINQEADDERVDNEELTSAQETEK